VLLILLEHRLQLTELVIVAGFDEVEQQASSKSSSFYTWQRLRSRLVSFSFWNIGWFIALRLSRSCCMLREYWLARTNLTLSVIMESSSWFLWSIIEDGDTVVEIPGGLLGPLQRRPLHTWDTWHWGVRPSHSPFPTTRLYTVSTKKSYWIRKTRNRTWQTLRQLWPPRPHPQPRFLLTKKKWRKSSRTRLRRLAMRATKSLICIFNACFCEGVSSVEMSQPRQ